MSRIRSIHLVDNPDVPAERKGPVALEAVADFLCAHRPDVFPQWNRETLLQYLGFHRSQRAVAVAIDNTQVLGVGIAWRGFEPGIEDPWHEWDEAGDCLYFAQFHATDPIAVCALFMQLARRAPDWPTLKLIGNRHGRRVVLHPNSFMRLFQASRHAVVARRSCKSHGHQRSRTP